MDVMPATRVWHVEAVDYEARFALGGRDRRGVIMSKPSFS